MFVYLLFGTILLLPASHQQMQQIVNQPDMITFNSQQASRSSPIVPFTFPSASTGSSFSLPTIVEPQQSPPVFSVPSSQQSEVVGIRGSGQVVKNQSTSQPIQQNGFSIPTAMLSLALDMGRCKSNAENDCATNTVFSPLSIASTLTMLLMGTS